MPEPDLRTVEAARDRATSAPAAEPVREPDLRTVEAARDRPMELLTEMYRRRETYIEVLGGEKTFLALEDNLGRLAALMLLTRPMIVLLGHYDAGKLTIVALLAKIRLETGHGPILRLYTKICPVEGLGAPTYRLAVLGVPELWLRLRQVIGRIASPSLAQAAQAALGAGSDVRDAARRVREALLEGLELVQASEDRIMIADAAFVCRSIEEFAGDSPRIEYRELRDGRVSAFDQALRIVAWHKQAGYEIREPADGQDLAAMLANMYDRDRLERRIEELGLHGDAAEEFRMRFEYGLRLGVLDSIEISVPSGGLLRPGFVCVDAPGRGGSKLERLIGENVALAAAAVLLVSNINHPGGGEEKVLMAELKGKALAMVLNHCDTPLSTDAIKRAADRLDGPEEEALAAARELVATFLTLIRKWDPEERPLRLLADERPEASSLMVLTYAKYGENPFASEICDRLRHLNRWLRHDVADLPEHQRAAVLAYEGAAARRSPRTSAPGSVVGSRRGCWRCWPSSPATAAWEPWRRCSGGSKTSRGRPATANCARPAIRSRRSSTG